MLVGPWVPHPKVDASVRAKLFLIVDDHSRLLVDGVFYAYENARAGQDTLRRAIVRRGVPEVLYADYADVRVMPTSEGNALWQKGNPDGAVVHRGSGDQRQEPGAWPGISRR